MPSGYASIHPEEGAGTSHTMTVSHGGSGAAKLDYSSLPNEFRTALAAFDEDGNGDVDVNELKKAAKTYKDFHTSNGCYDLTSFPNDLQTELKVFDVDGDGTVSSDELGRACVLYRESKQKFKKAVRGAMVLAVIVLLLLAANCGLVFAVVYLTKDTAVGSSGAMTVKNSDQPVSVGSINQIVTVNADLSAWGKLRNDTFNAFAVKPDNLGITLKDGSAFNFPVEWFEASASNARLGNTALGYSVNISDAEGVVVTYPSNSKWSLSNIPVTQIRVFLRPGVALGGLEAEGEVNDEELNFPMSSGMEGAMKVQETLSLIANKIPVEDIPESQLNNPQTKITAGPDDDWMFVIMPGMAEVDLLSQCCDIVNFYNGTCTGAPEFTNALNLGNMPVTIPRMAVAALRMDPDFQLDTNPCYVQKITKVKLISSPAVHLMQPHHQDPNQWRRHDDIKRMVMSTHRGRRLLKHIARRHARELWYNPQERKARKLQAVSVTDAGGDSILEALAADTGFGADCYVGGIDYVGTGNTVQGSDAACLPWASNEVAGLNSPPDNYADVAACRKGFGYDFPLCPFEENGARGYAKCAVPHCVKDLFGDWGSAPLGNEDWDWGLERISTRCTDAPPGRRNRLVVYDCLAFREDITYDITLDRETVNGEGVHCFIIDSGVTMTHNEFGPDSRRGLQYDAFTGDYTQEDDFGHGTHVAGTVAGLNHGVAPGCKVHAIKALKADGGSGATLQAAVNQAIVMLNAIKEGGAAYEALGGQANMAAEPNAKAVVNLSLGGGYGDYWDSWVQSLTDAGFVVVAAAGNEDSDACTKSPAHCEGALTVGATYVDDTKTIFSNWGSCVQLFAPGAGIKSAEAFTQNGFVWMGGTSMAAPFVSGAVALYLETHPDATPADAIKFMIDTATVGVVQGLDTAVFQGHGMSDADFAEFQATYTAGDLDVTNEATNIASTNAGNRLLHWDFNAATAPASTPAPSTGTGPAPVATAAPDPADLPLCNEAPDLNPWSPWQESTTCPATGVSQPICGPKYFLDDPTMWNPVQKRVRYCDNTVCICDLEQEVETISCNPDQSESLYTYIESCGTPAAMLGNEADISWITEKRILFSPVENADGTTYTTCVSEFDYDPTTKSLPFPSKKSQGAISLKNYLTYYSYVTISLPVTFSYYSPVEGDMITYRKLNIFPNGYINFAIGDGTGDETNTFTSDVFNFTGFFGSSRGVGISALYTGLAIDGCGLSSCGDVRIWVGKADDNGLQTNTAGYKITLTWESVPVLSPATDTLESRNTFQVVLHSGSSGKFELNYGHVSPDVMGAAAYGVHHGQSIIPASLNNPQTSLQCAA